MDRNLERNLAKVNAWRARGDLPKARRRLAELVQEHPDTPDYRLDLARVCLDLGDSHAALGEVRLLLRQLPDRRDELLAAVEEHFQASGNLPAGQFLFEDHVARGDHEAAGLVLERFTEAQLQQTLDRCATKIATVRSHRAEAGPDASGEDGGGALRQAWWGSFHCALALKQIEAAATHAVNLLRGAESDRKQLLAVLERRGRSAQTPPPLLAVLGEARVRDGRVVDGLSALLGAAERDRSLLPRVEAICAQLDSFLADLPAGLRARGHLARLAGRAEEAIDLYRQAVTRDPQGIRSLLELITPADHTPETRPYSLFRVELLARACDGPGLAAALEQLRQVPGIEPGDLRDVLAPHLQAANPDPVLLLSAATLAINAGDVEELERLSPACAHLTRAQLQRLVHAVDKHLGLQASEPELINDPITGELVPVTPPAAAAPPAGEPGERARWLRALVRLHAAAGDAAGANARLLLLWRDAPESGAASGTAGGTTGRAAGGAPVAELARFTREILAQVPPSPATLSTLAAVLPPEMQRELLPDLLTRLARTGPEASDEQGELEASLVALAAGDEGQARTLGEQFASRADLAARLPLAHAASRLFGGDEEGGLHALAELAHTRPEYEERQLELLLARARRRPPHAAVALAAAQQLRLEDRLREAVDVLQPVLAAAPERAEEIGLFFESVLAAEPDQAEVWLAYLDGLLRAGRYRRLRQVLPRAEQALPAVEIGRLRVYCARLRFEEGDPQGALLECELALQLADPPLGRLDELLGDLLVVNPALARAHLLRAMVAGAAGRLGDALAHATEALRRDPGLRAEAERAVRRLAEGRLLGGADSLALARFHLALGGAAEAAAYYQEALQASPAVAPEVAADLGAAGLGAAGPIPAPLGRCLAQALRLAGDADAAAATLERLCAEEPGLLDWALKELATLETAQPRATGPARARARLLGLPYEPPPAVDEATATPAVEESPAPAGSPASLPGNAAAISPADLPADGPADLPAEATETAWADAPAEAAPDAPASLPAEAPARASADTARDPQAQAGPPETPADGGDGAGVLAEDDATAPAARAHLAAAVRLALADRPLEARAHLRALPLAGASPELSPAARMQALWLLAHVEESLGRWAEACACYRALAAMPGAEERARWWLNWNYGRLLEQSRSPLPLVLEKTGALSR